MSQIVFLGDLTVLRFFTTLWAKMSQNSYLREFCALSVTNRVLSWFDRFTAYYQLYEQKCHKTHISASFEHKYVKIVFLADLTVLRLIRTVWAKISQNSYLRQFCAQV